MVFIRGNFISYSEKKMPSHDEPPDVETEQSLDRDLTLEELYADDTWFQVLFIKSDSRKKRISQILDTKPKKEFTESFIQSSKNSSYKKIKDYLPSQGVKFPEELQKKLENPRYLANYYSTVRTLLQTRKISQLIAKSWWAYRVYQAFLEYLGPEKDHKYCYQNGNWGEFLGKLDDFLRTDSNDGKINNGKMYLEHLKKEICKDDIKQIVLDVLDGLIAREIFLTANASARGITKIKTWDDNNSIYNPDPSSMCEASQETAMLILPSNRSWIGIRLALLFAGQVFRDEYKREIIKEGTDNSEKAKYSVVQNEYYQICQPIMSTEEIVSHYAIELAIESFHGQIDEIPMGLGFELPFLQVKIPYPPIPTEDQVKREELQKWFNAPDDSNGESDNLGFFVKKNGEYTTTIQHPTPPYPYIPISSS